MARTTTRRNLLKAAALGGAAAGLGVAMKPGTVVPAAEATAQAPAESHGRGHHPALSGPMANATVSFGQWSTDPPLNRHRTASPGSRNVHSLLPYEATIQAGGAINFIIAGLHQLGIYDDGTQLSDINPALVPPSGLPLIDDPNRRIYRGLDPTALGYVPVPPATTPLLALDRVEVVHFSKPGRYLVVCLFLPHFLDEMHGFVRVLP